MTREEFMEILEDKGYYYNGEGESIVVDHKGNLNLTDLEEIPSGIEFSNRGHIVLDSLKVVPPKTKFDNSGNVWLNSVESLSPDTYFGQLTDEIFLRSLIGGWFSDRKGIIDGIDHGRILNKMVEDRIFDRR